MVHEERNSVLLKNRQGQHGDRKHTGENRIGFEGFNKLIQRIATGGRIRIGFIDKVGGAQQGVAGSGFILPRMNRQAKGGGAFKHGWMRGDLHRPVFRQGRGKAQGGDFGAGKDLTAKQNQHAHDLAPTSRSLAA